MNNQISFTTMTLCKDSFAEGSLFVIKTDESYLAYKKRRFHSSNTKAQYEDYFSGKGFMRVLFKMAVETFKAGYTELHFHAQERTYKIGKEEFDLFINQDSSKLLPITIDVYLYEKKLQWIDKFEKWLG